jgi:hypothetical protein
MDLQPSKELFWPQECCEIIPLIGGSDTKRTYFKGKQWIHGSLDDSGNHVFGFTEEIDVAHGGLWGWTRICFTIVEAAEDEGDDNPFNWSLDSEYWVHGYEAVIIPGGRLMLGRWLDMHDTGAKGPFIFWDS